MTAKNEIETFPFLIFRLFHNWTQNVNRPANGSLVQLITKDSKTEFIPA